MHTALQGDKAGDCVMEEALCTDATDIPNPQVYSKSLLGEQVRQISSQFENLNFILRDHILEITNRQNDYALSLWEQGVTICYYGTMCV